MNFALKELGKHEREKAIQIFSEIVPSGFIMKCSREVRESFLVHCLASPLGYFILALDENIGKGVGYVIAMKNSARFWLNFLLTHSPRISVEIFLNRYQSTKRGDIDRLAGGGNRNFATESAWSPSSNKIGRIFFIGVLPAYRGTGLGVSMYYHLAQTLKQEGCTRIEAHIDEGNLASLALHRKIGYEIRELQSGYFKAVLNLENADIKKRFGEKSGMR
jgi:ribosomal protein S18 acetylase RimI-like enzyme